MTEHDTGPDTTAAPPDVKYNTLDFTLTGAFMVALTRHRPEALPSTLRGFMGLLSTYARSHHARLAQPEGRNSPAPDLVFDQVGGADFTARFVPNPGEDGPTPLGIWQVDGVLAVCNVREEAAIALVQNRANQVYVRLPEPGNIGDKELTAQEMSAKGEVFDLPSYIAPYQKGELSALEFVWANVGDYTTRSCR